MTPAPALTFDSAAGRWALLATILGSALAGIDATVVNVALPDIGADLGADFTSLQWTVSAYALTLASFILLGGTLGDRFGRRRVFVVGVVWFALAMASRRAVFIWWSTPGRGRGLDLGGLLRRDLPDRFAFVDVVGEIQDREPPDIFRAAGERAREARKERGRRGGRNNK